MPTPPMHPPLALGIAGLNYRDPMTNSRRIWTVSYPRDVYLRRQTNWLGWAAAIGMNWNWLC
jgi:hypothetical protein